MNLRNFLISLILGICCLSALADAPADSDISMDVQLLGSLFRGDVQGADSKPLLLGVRKRGGQWQRVWGTARSYNVSHPVGRVVKGQVSPEAVSLTVAIYIEGDAWVPGGWGFWNMTLTRGADGTLEGTYEGTWRGIRSAGKARGKIRPDQKLKKPGCVPAKPGEHPRLLFRKSDLPALKAKAKTKLGQAALEKMNTAAGLALKYQLTGEKKYAQQAEKLTREHMSTMDNGSKMIRSRVWGWRMEQMALAYDMCYDAWDEQFKRELADHLVYCSERLFHQKGLFHAEIGWHMASTYPGTIMYGTGLSGLALLGEKGPAPDKPRASFTVAGNGLTVEPAKEYDPPKGVPVVPYTRSMPKKWITVGGFKPDEKEDWRADVCGLSKSYPKPGQKVKHGKRTDEFRPLKSFYSGQIDITNNVNRIFFSTSYFFTVYRNDKPRWVRVETGYDQARVFLAKTELTDGDIVKLEKGLYPMMVQAYITETTPWGKHLMKPQLVEMTEAQAKEEVARLRWIYQQEVEQYEFDKAQWARRDGADVRFIKLYELADRKMVEVFREHVNDGGFQAGTTNPMPLEGPNKYALAHRNMFCVDASSYPDVTHYIPRKIFSHLYTDDRKAMTMRINGPSGFMIENVYHETRDTAGQFYAVMYPLVPEAYKPAALWDWNRRMSVSDSEDVTKILNPAARPYPYGPYEMQPVYAFINYPLEAEPKHPGKVMPLTWAATGYGWYAFRNAWSGKDDFLVQVFAKDRQTGAGGRENAGTFRVMGLGQEWCGGNGWRFGENVVRLDKIETNKKGRGDVTYRDLDKDGSGVVSINLDEVYGLVGNGDISDAYSRYGDILNRARAKKTGVSGMRSVAVDYSGKSGAPMLMVIVDRVSGGDKKVWTWQLETERVGVEKADKNKKTSMVTWRDVKAPYRPGSILKETFKRLDDDPSVKVNGNGFELTRGDANLKATFVTPKDVDVQFGVRDRYILHHKSGVSRTRSKALFATGGDSYFTIITIQKDKAPEVKVTGKGLDAKVTVGKRTIEFDGKKVIFGDAE
ncbi:MAG: hypothetical protein ACLFVU_03300 [Phycisphaerae bacterium]